jgi:hypothetical protein
MLRSKAISSGADALSRLLDRGLTPKSDDFNTVAYRDYPSLDLRLRRSNSDSRMAEHVLIESQEEVRSDRGSSLRSDQIDNPGWIRK